MSDLPTRHANTKASELGTAMGEEGYKVMKDRMDKVRIDNGRAVTDWTGSFGDKEGKK